MPSSVALSVIVPVLDEQARIGLRLDELARTPGIDEVLVVDGGSSDGCADVARAHPLVQSGRARVLCSEAGRARQMNAGARAATGAALLFLHADTELPVDAARWVARAFADPEVVLGAFRTRTIDDESQRSAVWLRLADLRSRYTRVPYGDQALFVRREAFFAVGGFPDQPLMEDTELCLRLQKLGRLRTVKSQVRVSGRRFLAHPVRDTVLVNVFPLLYRLGVSPARLKRIYRDVR
jgi:rSAM/selenodomain-associated transferase 2